MNLRSLQHSVGALLVAALVLVSCGNDDGSGDNASAGTPDTPTAEATSSPEESQAGDDTAATEEAADAADDTAATEDAAEDTAATEEADADAPTEEIQGTQIAERELVITTPDGEQLTGTVFGSGEVGVVLAHMRGRDRTTWFDFARRAASTGYQALAFDFRGYGGSSGERDTALDVDLTAAVEALRDEGATRVVVMGASMGGTATVNVAGQLDLTGAVSISAPADFLGLPALAVAVNVGEPLLVVAAEDDQPYADAAVGIDERAPASQLIMFDGNAHGTNLFGTHENELTNLLLSFVRDRVS